MKKSHAIHALSLPADELAPEDPAALAGPTRAPIGTLGTLVGESWTPSPISSPVVRRYPHRGFSRACRAINSRTSQVTLGRPGRRPGEALRRATRRRGTAEADR